MYRCALKKSCESFPEVMILFSWTHGMEMLLYWQTVFVESLIHLNCPPSHTHSHTHSRSSEPLPLFLAARGVFDPAVCAVVLNICSLGNGPSILQLWGRRTCCWRTCGATAGNTAHLNDHQAHARLWARGALPVSSPTMQCHELRYSTLFKAFQTIYIQWWPKWLQH